MPSTIEYALMAGDSYISEGKRGQATFPGFFLVAPVGGWWIPAQGRWQPRFAKSVRHRALGGLRR